MKANEYAEFLRRKGIPEAEIQKTLESVDALEEGLAALGIALESTDKEDFYRVARTLIARGQNTPETFDALCGYLLWRGLRSQYVALTEITDCHNGMQTLADAIEARHGARTREQIFREPFPPLGADEAERCAYTRAVTERMAAFLTKEESRAAWFQVQHGIPASYWNRSDVADRETYRGCGNVADFLQLRRKERNAMLKGLHDRDELWYTMEITDEVLQFVTGDLHMEAGECDGAGTVVVTKVPYQPARWLHETDATLKRYFACHCPLVRESILRGEPIADDVCYCSLGHASHYLAGLGLGVLRGEVVESAVRGDERCRFVFYLPEVASGAPAKPVSG